MTVIDKGTHDQWKRGLWDRCSDIEDGSHRLVLKPPDCKGLSAWITYLMSLETLLVSKHRDCVAKVTADGRVYIEARGEQRCHRKSLNKNTNAGNRR